MKLIVLLLFLWLIYSAVKNITFGVLNGISKSAGRNLEKEDTFPFSDDEEDIGYNMEIMDIILSDDEEDEWD